MQTVDASDLAGCLFHYDTHTHTRFLPRVVMILVTLVDYCNTLTLAVVVKDGISNQVITNNQVALNCG